MSTVTLYPSGPPTGVDLGEAGAVVTNYGDGTVSYSDVAEPFVAEGTIAATATATLSGTQFFRATTGAVLGIVELDASLGSLEAIRAQLLAVGGVSPTLDASDAARPDVVAVTVPGAKPRRVPIADKQEYDLREFWSGAQPSDVIGHLHDALHKSAVTGGVIKPGDGYFEISEPITWEISARLDGLATFQNTVLRDGAILRGYGASIIQIPDTPAKGGGETWIALKSGANCPILRTDWDNSKGKRGPLYAGSYGVHGLLRGVVLDFNGRNQTAQDAVTLRDAAFLGFEDVRLVNPKGRGIVLSNCHDVCGHGVVVKGLEDAVANGTGNTTNGSAVITGATGAWAIGDRIAGPGIPANAYLVNVVGATITMSATYPATATATGVPLTGTSSICSSHLVFENATTDSWWLRCSMHAVSDSTVLFDTSARGNVVDGLFGFATAYGGVNARFKGGANNNRLTGRLDVARGHNARLDSTTFDNTIDATCVMGGSWGSVVDADAEWVAVFDDGTGNTAKGSGSRGWSGISRITGIHRFGPNAKAGYDFMGGGSDIPAGNPLHRTLGTTQGAKTCVSPVPQGWFIPAKDFEVVDGGTSTLVNVNGTLHRVLEFHDGVVDSAVAYVAMPRGCNRVNIEAMFVNLSPGVSGVIAIQVGYADAAIIGGNTLGADESTALVGVAIGANSQATPARFGIGFPVAFGANIIPGELGSLRVKRLYNDAADTLAASVGFYGMRVTPQLIGVA